MAPLPSLFRQHGTVGLTFCSGADDYFSSDLDLPTLSKFWARFNKPVLVLHSENDEFVPPTVDQKRMNNLYKTLNTHVSPLSGIIPGTGHTVLEEEARQWLAERVIQFLKRPFQSIPV